MAAAVPAAEVATTSVAESLPRGGRPDVGAAALRVSELFERHGATVLGLCRVLLRNEHEAEDATQQTFLAAYRSLLNGGEPRHAAAWLATIARNECWSIAARRMREPLGDTEPEGSLPDPVIAATERADLRELWRAIGALPRRQRTAILLREFSGLSYDELAVALGVSEPAVESLLFRARRELRTRLRPVYGSFVIAPLNAVRDALAPVAVKLGAGATAVVVAGGTVAAVETPTLLREVAVQPAVASVLPVRARPFRAAPVAQAAPRGGGRTALPSHRAPAPTRHSTPVLRPPASVSDISAAPSAGGVGAPPVVTLPAEPPVEAPAPPADPPVAPPEPPPSVGGDDSPGDDAIPATGDDGSPGTSGSDDGGTSSGAGSGGADDHSGPGGGGDGSSGSSGPGEGGDSSGPGGGDDGGTSGSSGPGGGGDDAVSGGSDSSGSGSGGSGSGGHGEPES
jgi:RNA polymerase sigma factor (sigma-70 family)